jgi:hypothetical protein
LTDIDVVARVFSSCLKGLWQFSYAQRFQDLFGLSVSLAMNTQCSDATFLEYGGMHPFNKSNSYLLEQIGWRGGVAEPNPSFSRNYAELRHCFFVEAAISPARGNATLFVPAKRRARAAVSQYADLQQPGISIPIQLITLDDLISFSDIPGQITFLSADTEGGELETLLAYPYLAQRVRSICIEYGESRDLIAFELSALGYRRVLHAVSGIDDWYVSEAIVTMPRRQDYELAVDLGSIRKKLEALSLPSQGFDEQRREAQALQMLEKIESDL